MRKWLYYSSGVLLHYWGYAKIALFAILCMVTLFFAGYQYARTAVSQDCATLNQTVINGQWVMCRPHDAKPRDIL